MNINTYRYGIGEGVGCRDMADSDLPGLPGGKNGYGLTLESNPII